MHRCTCILIQSPPPRVRGHQNIQQRVLEKLNSNIPSRSNEKQPFKRPRLTGTQQPSEPLSSQSSEDPLHFTQPPQPPYSSEDPLHLTGTQQPSPLLLPSSKDPILLLSPPRRQSSSSIDPLQQSFLSSLQPRPR